MFKFIQSLFLIVFIVYLSGCATKIIQADETYNKVIVSLDSTNSEPYYLYSNNNKKFISKASSRDKQLVFRLPEINATNACLFVVNKKGKRVKVKNSSVNIFKSKLAPLYYAAKKDLQREKLIWHQSQKTLEEINGSLNYTQRKLVVNRAKNGNKCILPSMKNIPSRPKTRCKSYKECYKDATQICFAIAFGAEGCSMALSQEGVLGVIAGPSCAAVASSLAEEKYSVDNAIVDAVRGAVDDWANSMLKKEAGFLTNLFGVAIKLANYTSKYDSATSCRNSFINRHYAPYGKWRKQVDSIKNEPYKTKNACKALLRKKKLLKTNMVVANNNVKINAKHIFQLQKYLSKLEQQSQQMHLGCNK